MREIFANTYRNKKIIVTGHTGFKGSWLAHWLVLQGAEVLGISLPPDTSPNHFGLLQSKIQSLYIDIRNYEELFEAFSQFKPDIVFHLAAQPLVRKSYVAPRETYETNVIGTMNVLEASRHSKSVRSIVSITTDKVYDNKEWQWGYREIDNLGGHDPYSSSKACAEILCESYRKSFFNDSSSGAGILMATVRAGNVIGGGDWSEDRLIPDAVKAAYTNQPTIIRNPKSIRPWQHVLEPIYAYLLIGQKLIERKNEFSTAWNIGPVNEKDWSVKEVMDYSNECWCNIVIETPEQDQNKVYHEARNLKLDCSKAIQHLGWTPTWDTKKALEKTILWYKDFYENNQLNTDNDIKDFIKETIQKQSRNEIPVNLKLVANS